MKKLNLYLIYQYLNNDYDTYDSAVVAAESDGYARNIHPSGDDEWDDNTWCKPDQVKVTLIGNAEDNMKRGVICASFNAGW